MASGSGQSDLHGKGGTLHDAIQEAWDKAPKGGPGETEMEVVRIAVHGSNPISAYSVILRPGGGG